MALTSRCNLKCAHCYGSFGEIPVIEQPLSTWEKIMSILNDMGVLYINLSGGEATTYPGFEKLIAHLEKISMPFYLTTNGIVSENVLGKVIKNKTLLGVKISIDGISQQSYLKIRDPVQKRAVIYETVFNTLRHLKDNDVFVEAATLIHNGNIQELKRFPEVLASYGVKKWDLGLLMPEGRGAANRESLAGGLEGIEFNKRFVDEVSHEAEKQGIHTTFGDLRFGTLEKPIFICGAGTDFMSIEYDMSVYPCPLLQYTRFKNLYGFRMSRAEDIRKAWDSKPFMAWIDQKNYGCPTCALRDRCGRCIIQLSEEGKTDPYEDISACYWPA